MMECVSQNFGFSKSKAEDALATFEDHTCYEYAVALYVEATVLHMEHEYDEALEYYDKALKLYPNDEAIKRARTSF